MQGKDTLGRRAKKKKALEVGIDAEGTFLSFLPLVGTFLVLLSIT